MDTLLEQLSNDLPIVPPSAPIVDPEIQAQKRKNEFIRFGKRKNEFIRFGKRKNEFIRFGRSTGGAEEADDQAPQQEMGMFLLKKCKNVNF